LTGFVKALDGLVAFGKPEAAGLFHVLVVLPVGEHDSKLGIHDHEHSVHALHGGVQQLASSEIVARMQGFQGRVSLPQPLQFIYEFLLGLFPVGRHAHSFRELFRGFEKKLPINLCNESNNIAQSREGKAAFEAGSG
jgi:hypothetical protein